MSRRRKVASVLLASLLTGVAAVEVAPTPVRAANRDGAWSAVGSGMPNGTVFQIVTDADGSLYAGGTFTSASGVSDTRNIAKWNGTAWTAVGTGVTTAGPNGASGGVYALALDPGANPATSDDVIYVGGEVAGVGGVTVNRVAKWNGTAWSALGAAGATSNGVNNTTAQWDGVEEIVVVSPTEVYLGGHFDNAYAAAGGAVADSAGIAKWNGTTLSAVGTGIGGSDPIVNGLTKDANGNVIATGQFTTAGGTASLRAAKWNGTTWSNFGGTTSGPNGLTAAVATSGSDVFVGGTFASAANTGTAVANTNFIAMWDDSASAWVSIGSVAGTVVEELRVIGNYLYAGGVFTSIGGVTANNIARMNLSTMAWEPLVSGCLNGVLGAVRSIIDAGTDVTVGGVQMDEIYVAGAFTDAGGVAAADRIAKFTPGEAAGCGGSVLLDSPSKFIISAIDWGVKIGSKRGIAVSVSWTAPIGSNAPTFYKVSVAKATGPKPDLSFTEVTPYPELDCWTFENSCRIPLVYGSNGGFGITEARFTLVGYSFNGTTSPLVLDPVSPYLPVFPPGSPTGVKAVGGWGKVTVSWTAPTETGSYPITNYLVLSSPGNRACISTLKDAKLTECTYTNLTPGTNYTFKVQALNGAGWSNESAASNVSSPQGLRITEYGRKKVTFSFNPGSDITAKVWAQGFLPFTAVTPWIKVGNGNWQALPPVKTDAKGIVNWKRRFPRNQNGQTVEVGFENGGNFSNTVKIRGV